MPYVISNSFEVAKAWLMVVSDVPVRLRPIL